ncbi:hypothetical protein OIU84_013674 [Salix udensis]|uniref:Uncharacterized protein n=1 Tax=Salix udensis TaxID=889485 RepID=A0AAD6JJT0_9ROSI|nr:hypothetical protein OIU84_013674 [Salix udensis]
MARLLSPAQHEELEHQSQSTGSKPLILSLTDSSLNPMVNSLVNEGYLRCTRFRALHYLCYPLRHRKYATGEDALKGWLVSVYASSMKKSSHELSA